MGISKKGKRKIIINSKTYLWWVFNECDQTEFDGVQVKIVPENQIGYLKYGLEQNEKRFLVLGLRNDEYKTRYDLSKI